MPILEKQHFGRRSGWIIKWEDPIPGSRGTAARSKWFWRKKEATDFIKKKWPKKKGRK